MIVVLRECLFKEEFWRVIVEEWIIDSLGLIIQSIEVEEWIEVFRVSRDCGFK